MKIFLSYPSDQRELAEHLHHALEGEGHEVFMDRAELKAGEPYHEALRQAIEEADAMVFIITPRSVTPGSYALTELDLARRRWRTPGGRVLPVLAEPTPVASIPPYLRAVTLLQPRGDVVAETVAAVDGMRRGRPLVVWAGLLAGVLVLAAAGGWFWQRHQRQLAREGAELATAVQLCASGSHAVGWDQFTLILAARPDDAAARLAHADCGMRWLREMRVVSDKETFSAQAGRIQPVLAQGLAEAAGQRRADLRAHLGWAEFLRSRDGVSAAEPASHYEAALADDPGNVYAHAMWAHNLVWRSGRLDAQARQHFAEAARSPRERAWVRGMQLASSYHHRGLYGYAVQVADQMRRGNERLAPAQLKRLRSYVFDSMVLSGRERAELLGSVPAAELLVTYEWLFPVEAVPQDRSQLDLFTRGWLRAAAGERDRARQELEGLRQALEAAQAEGRLMRAVGEVLAELGPGG